VAQILSVPGPNLISNEPGTGGTTCCGFTCADSVRETTIKTATTTQLIDSGINLRLPMIFLLIFIFYDQ
jgi:hypothetical protein